MFHHTPYKGKSPQVCSWSLLTQSHLSSFTISLAFVRIIFPIFSLIPLVALPINPSVMEKRFPIVSFPYVYPSKDTYVFNLLLLSLLVMRCTLTVILYISSLGI